MTPTRLLFYCASMLIILSSCTKEVKIDIPGYEEKIVIDGSIEAGQPPIVLISTSKDIYSATTQEAFLAGFVSNAIVTVSDGTNTVQLDQICSDNLPPGTGAIAAQFFGIPESELANYHLCIYSSFNPLIWGKIGKNYDLKVEVDGKSYTATTSILPPVSLDKSFWVPDDKYPDYGYSWATLSDPPTTYNAYMWEVKQINKLPNGKAMNDFFSKPFTPVFDDQFFDGLSFDFFYENPMSFDDETLEDKYKGFYKSGDTVVIKLSVMDKDVYNFLEKKYVQLSTAGNPFATPTNIPTNINGGALGIWAGFSASYDTLICVP